MKKSPCTVQVPPLKNGFLLSLFLAVFVSFSLVMLTGCESSSSSYTFHNENVKGPVKKVVERTFDAVKDSAGWETGKLREKQILVFNAEGRLAKRRVLGPDTTLVERFEYEYRHGQRQIERRYNRQGELTHRKIYSYPWWRGVTGKVGSRVMASKDSLLWTVTYQFDDKKREVRKSVYGPSGRLSLQVTYRYDRRGFLFQRIGVDKYSYRFSKIDHHGNWRRRLNSKGGIQKTITRRNISYRTPPQ